MTLTMCANWNGFTGDFACPSCNRCCNWDRLNSNVIDLHPYLLTLNAALLHLYLPSMVALLHCSAMAMHSGAGNSDDLRDRILELMLREPKAQEGLLRRLRAAHLSIFGPPHPQRKVYHVPEPKAKGLDESALLAACSCSSPEDALVGAGSSLNFVTIDAPALPAFVNLRILDLKDNSLNSLAALAGLPVLQSLNLSANGIKVLGELPEGSFQQLRKLDLSFNLLSAGGDDEFVTSGLALLPQLSDLNLSNNGLSNLAPLEGGHFTSLSRLSLEGNRLASRVLVSLAPLARLQHLDFANNRVAQVSGGSRVYHSSSSHSLVVHTVSQQIGRGDNELVLLPVD